MLPDYVGRRDDAPIPEGDFPREIVDVVRDLGCTQGCDLKEHHHAKIYGAGYLGAIRKHRSRRLTALDSGLPYRGRCRLDLKVVKCLWCLRCSSNEIHDTELEEITAVIAPVDAGRESY